MAAAKLQLLESMVVDWKRTTCEKRIESTEGEQWCQEASYYYDGERDQRHFLAASAYACTGFT